MNKTSAILGSLAAGCVLVAGARLAPRARAAIRMRALGLPSRALFDRLRVVVCDCDGVLFAHGTALAGVPEAVNACKRAGKRVIFVTNSATQSRRSLADKLTQLGFDGVAEADCVTSASAAAAYLQRHHPAVRTAYVVGQQGLFDELQLVGIRALGAMDTGGMQSLVDEHFADAPAGEVDAVVVGMQMEALCYQRLAKAAAYAQDRSRPFIATNSDQNWPGGVGVLLPAGGAMVAFVAYAAERAPDVTVGKPSRDLAQLLVAQYGLDPATTLMVGDRCNTDIAFGKSVGMWTLLVLTGCHTLDDVRSAPTDSVPDFVAPSLAALAAFC